jgi:TatD DNase family protein
MWIDTHCHLDAAAFEPDRAQVLARARAAGVRTLVLPAVHPGNFGTVRRLAHAHGLGYALGIHPAYVERCAAVDLSELRMALKAHQHDPHLVAVGEIGLDHAIPCDRTQAEYFLVQQLKLAQHFGLPVIVHMRRSADRLHKHLRAHGARGIVHAFNGSAQQARALDALGFKLGFGGAMTFEAALQIRRLAQTLPEHSLVLETDAPDMPPHWLYRSAEQRAQGLVSRNEPGELPQIAQTLATLRGWTMAHTAQVSTQNALTALPRLAGLI